MALKVQVEVNYSNPHYNHIKIFNSVDYFDLESCTLSDARLYMKELFTSKMFASIEMYPTEVKFTCSKG